MIAKRIHDISIEDIEQLIEDSVLEGKTLEYKESIPGNLESDKKEFLADISSFANSMGGDFILGIKTKEGEPIELSGLSEKNIDGVISRLENIIRDGIYPRINCHIIPIKRDRLSLLIIRVDQSLNSPHRIIFKNWGKFFTRNSNGKYEMDIEELRTSFNLADSIGQKIANFRLNRVSKLKENDCHLPILNGPKIAVHLIPLQAFSTKIELDLKEIQNFRSDSDFSPIGSNGWSWWVNLDGFATYSKISDKMPYSYTQFYRNGIVEAADQSILDFGSEEKILPGAFQDILNENIKKYLRLQKKLGINMPIFVFVTLIGIEGYSLGFDKFKTQEDGHPIKERDLFLPEVVIEDYENMIEEKIDSIFKLVWNAAGIVNPPT